MGDVSARLLAQGITQEDENLEFLEPHDQALRRWHRRDPTTSTFRCGAPRRGTATRLRDGDRSLAMSTRGVDLVGADDGQSLAAGVFRAAEVEAVPTVLLIDR